LQGDVHILRCLNEAAAAKSKINLANEGFTFNAGVIMNELRTQTDPFDIEPLEDMFRGFLRPWPGMQATRSPRIKIDVSETEAAYQVKADVPGVRKEDIDVRVDGNLVTISAETKKDQEEKKGGRVIRSERQYGYTSRSFTLASDIEDGKVGAKYNDGVLELTLPKKAASASRRINVA
jgi:HSP20 family protein